MLRASHLGPTVFVTLLATLLAVAVGQSAIAVALVLVTVLTGQLSIGWSNDWLDAARDGSSGRVEKPIVARAVSATRVRNGAFVALALTVPLSFANGVWAGLAHLGLVGSGWVYNLGVKATLWSWLPYAVGFGLLPAFITLGLPAAPWPPAWVMVVGALLGVGAHFANVLPDIDDDLSHGIRGLPQQIGVTAAGATALVVLVSASAIVLLAPAGPPTVTAWLGALAVLVIAGFGAWSLRPTGRSDAVFPAALGVALIDVVMVLDAARSIIT